MAKSTIGKVFNNWMSHMGAFLASATTLVILFFLIFNIYANIDNPYIGIYIYLLLPPVLVVGLAMMPIGMFRTWRRWQKTGDISYRKWPYIDFNKPSHRIPIIIFAHVAILVALVGSVVGYQAFHYSESVEFCGKLCHSVMEPEFVAYQNSPHARVSCSACHVGAGAGWYTKSKLSGLYQVYAVNAKVYPKPIPTPLKNLRPAQETCEQCHWPEQFFGAQQKQFNHYMYDQTNSHWPINMLIKTGGGDPKTGQTAGIHWHMNIGVKVEYIARDEKRQDIPWVRITDRETGRVTLYQDVTNPLSDKEIANGEPREMDCMDCHNRPSHIFYSPDYAIDKAILTGQIDHDLPDIKRVAVEAMAKEYKSREEALMEIANYITDFYRLKMPDYYEKNRVRIDKAIIGTENAFSKNIFPEMNVRWESYQDNIGHFDNPGCMRCHLGNHKTDDGIIITHQCGACHSILSQGIGDRLEISITQEGLEFSHPEDIDEAWREMGCWECHTGLQP